MKQRSIEDYPQRRSEKPHICLVVIVYTLSQWFLLVASGSWWDDWLFIDKDWEKMYQVMLSMSLPLEAYINGFLWLFPDGVYRIFVFANYLIGSILIYLILRTIDAFSENDCLWITLLYTAMPINDARITWICCGYSIGLLSYWIAFFMLTKWVNMHGKKAAIMRVLIWLVLFFSFNTESLLIMPTIMLIYIVYQRLHCDWSQYVNRENLKRVLLCVLRHVDFLILPILYYFLHHIVFPGTGEGIYYRHNYVDWINVPILLIKSPIYMIINFAAEFVYNFALLIFQKNIYIIAFLIVPMLTATIIYCAVWWKKRKSLSSGADMVEPDNAGSSNGKFLIVMIFISAFVFYMGMFAYYLRNHGYVATREYNGRHSLLFGLGSAMLVFYLVRLFFRKGTWKLLYIYVIIFGVVYFNTKYLEWQEDYYQSLRIEYAFCNSEEIINNDTFCALLCHPGINMENYRLQGNIWEATGKWDKKATFGTGLLGDPDIDGIIEINNAPIPYSVIIRQKTNEIFNKSEFERYISETSDVRFYPITEDEASIIADGGTDIYQLLDR